ncbi:hypothetical protein LENED_009751 [Lentinula edodes]|uniref:Uncharacterized protein n=1 Tax=Lentinula edodes TaxID=5353 RepID=A0A1Q3EKK8_LENED|nr:hypothetical protein LENED_009751 [Lentinula edodes]
MDSSPIDRHRDFLLSSPTYMGNPHNTIIKDGSFFHDGNMMLYNMRYVPGKGKPKVMPITFVGRVLSSGNNTGLVGNYVGSKDDPKHGKRTAFLGRPFDEGFMTDWDTTISTFSELISLLSKDQGADVSYLWQDDDVANNDGTFRFGCPLFRALKAGEHKDDNIPPVIPKGKESSTFWTRAVDGYAFATFPAVDINGNSIPNEDVQSIIEGATVAIDAVMRGWKFKSDKRWGFAVDVKRLTVLHGAEEEEDIELPSLPGSQDTTATDDGPRAASPLYQIGTTGSAVADTIPTAVNDTERKVRKGKGSTAPGLSGTYIA